MEYEKDIELVNSLNKKTDLLDYLRTLPADLFFPVNKKGSANEIKEQILFNLEGRLSAYNLLHPPEEEPFKPLPFRLHHLSAEEILENGGIGEISNETNPRFAEELFNAWHDLKAYYNNFTNDEKNKMPHYLSKGHFIVYFPEPEDYDEYNSFIRDKLRNDEHVYGYYPKHFEDDYNESYIKNLILFYEYVGTYADRPYVMRIDILETPNKGKQVPRGILGPEHQYIRDPTTFIKGVDIGYKLPTITYGNEPGLCGPNILAEVLKDTRVTFTNQPVMKNTPKVTVNIIVAEIDKLRGEKSDPSKGYKIEEMAYVAEKANMKFFYVINSFGKAIHKYNNPKQGNQARLSPGCVCFCNSLHFTHVPLNTAVGISADDLIPQMVTEDDFKDANIHFKIEEELPGRNSFYLPFPVNELAIIHLKTTGVSPNIIRINEKDKTITCFSIGYSLYKYVENMEITRPWLESLNMRFYGQSLSSMAYTFWQKSVKPCLTSTLFYKEMKRCFPYCHNGSLPLYNKRIRNKSDLKHLKYVDCTKCFTSCIEEMQCGRFDFGDEVEPYDASLPINPCAFYYTSVMSELIKDTYWPHFGPGEWYLGAVIIEYRKYVKIEIMAQIIPSSTYKQNELSGPIREIFKNGGKMACNSVIGMFVTSSYNEDTKTILTDSLDEMAYYLENEDCTVDVININDRDVYKLTATLNSYPVYENYLPIAKTCHQWANLKLFKKVMELNALDALVGISTDCLIFDARLVDLKLPMKTRDLPRGVFAIEDRDPKFIYNSLEKPTNKTITPPSYPVYNEFTEVPLDKSIFCNAPAGMGKTFILHETIAKLRENGYNPLITSATGVTASNLDPKAITTHSALGLSLVDGDKNKSKVNSSHTHIIGEEFYYLDSRAQNAMMKLRHTNPKIHMILFGSNIQLSVNGRMLPNKSSYIEELCHGNQLVLTRNYRFDSSPKLAELCTEYIDYFDKKGPCPDITKYSLGMTDEDLAITATRKMAELLNNHWTDFYIPPCPRTDLIYTIYPGMPLVKLFRSTVNGMTIINGQFFVIRMVYPNIWLEYTDINRRSRDPPKYLPIHNKELSQYQRAWAITCHSAQGSTIDRPYTVYESEKAKRIAEKNPEWLYWHYVAYSRGKKIEFLNIRESFSTYDDEPTFYEDL